MLNLNRSERVLTQGAPPGERALPAAGGTPPGGQPAAGTAPAESATTAAAPAAGPAIDPAVIARRVYELLQQDLSVYHERKASPHRLRANR